MTLDELPTPSLIVDRDVFVANCDRIREKAVRSNVGFRPHVKTHKTREGARLQHGGKRGAITVSTLAEAEFFADGGFDDITYAVPIAPSKLERCADLATRVRSLNLLIDHSDALKAIEEFGETFDVFLKVDCGAHRAGVDPNNPMSLELAKRMAKSKAIRFRGLLTHAGHSYNAKNPEEIKGIAEEEARVVREFAEVLRGAGVESLVRSVGATPTVSVVDTIPECDEVRPGNYVFYDAFQATIGSCRLEDCSATVLATVIGNYPEQKKLMVDAGALALSKDLGPRHIDPRWGYGVVCDLQMRRLPFHIVSISQEHGQIVATERVDLSRFPIGMRLRIVPNHSCLTAASYDVFYVMESGEVVDEWRPVRGW